MEREVIWNLLSFIEYKTNNKIPLKLKILSFPNKITKDDLMVNGDMVFYHHRENEQLKDGMLPEGLKIKNNLYISYQPHLTKLPNNLDANIVLINDTKIDEIPNNFRVRNIFIGNSVLAKKYTNKEIYDIVKSKGGLICNIYREDNVADTVCTNEEYWG